MNKREKEVMDALLRCVGNIIAAKHKWLEGEEEAYMHLLSLSKDIKSYPQFLEITENLYEHFFDNDSLVRTEEWDPDISHGKYLFYMEMEKQAKEWGYNCLNTKYNNKEKQ